MKPSILAAAVSVSLILWGAIILTIHQIGDSIAHVIFLN